MDSYGHRDNGRSELWEGLVNRAGVRAGYTVLVHAGEGGVGNAAVQIALAHGAKVFATVSDDNRSIIDALGAIPIDRYAQPKDYVAEHIGGEGFSVYNTLGGAVLDASFGAVKRYTGHVVSCLGWGAHSLAQLSFRAASLRSSDGLSLSVDGSRTSERHHLSEWQRIRKWLGRCLAADSTLLA